MLPLLEPWAPAIQTGSAVVLIILALAMFGRELAGAGNRTATARHPAGSLLPTFLLTLVNPMTLVLFAGAPSAWPVQPASSHSASRGSSPRRDEMRLAA